MEEDLKKIWNKINSIDKSNEVIPWIVIIWIILFIINFIVISTNNSKIKEDIESLRNRDCVSVSDYRYLERRVSDLER